MIGKNLVEMQIPVEEVENIDELVREGYYGCRSDAIRDIIRRGATYLRLRLQCQKESERMIDDYKMEAGNGEKRIISPSLLFFGRNQDRRRR